MFTAIKKSLFSLKPAQFDFDMLGFERGRPEVDTNLSNVVRVFGDGFNQALVSRDPEALIASINENYSEHLRGFVHEGVGMYLGLMDFMKPWGKSRLAEFAEKHNPGHLYIMTVGAGVALGRVPWGMKILDRYLAKLNHRTMWCILDGYGFHEGIFHSRKYFTTQEYPKNLPEWARAQFDMGLGRSLWWARGANPDKIAEVINRFPEDRQAEFWNGLGIAITYAGGISQEDVLRFREVTGKNFIHFAAGLPFAAKMRKAGDNRSEWTDNVLNTFLGISSDKLVDIVDEAIAEMEKIVQADPELNFKVHAHPTLRKVLYERIEKVLISSKKMPAQLMKEAVR